MRPSEALNHHRADIRRIVCAHRGSNPRVFGSVARGEDTEESDLDILIDQQPHLSLMDLAKMETEIEEVTGFFKIDIVPVSCFKSPHIRASVFAEAQAI